MTVPLSISCDGQTQTIPVTRVHTLVIGSGAAGLNAAVQVVNGGIDDVLILTEGLKMGTSINTGSDKQTYYKLALCADDADAPRLMAENYFAGGSMHGDLALVEASCSARAFLHLVQIGVPFPQDPYGQFVGYKTDHDPRQRATSIGPYTSREMCKALIREVERKGIPVREKTNVVSLVTVGEGENKRAAGALALNEAGELEAFMAEAVIFAVGGPGGLYKTSVYPNVHTGAIGLALCAGAKAQSLPESQYGLASIKFRWNVSGTYMQVIPRFISTDTDGESNPREFMRDYFDSIGDMNSMVFLKGYQWPFDPRKVVGGSSIVDILVYIETVLNGRRVFLDFRDNPEDFSFDAMSDEAREYLEKSEAAFGTPIERLRKMNPGAIDLYSDHGIDITTEMLEIAVCAQHNNGGLAADHWWQSLNIKRLFPVGEVNGSHGVYRPGGSALNSGQVAGFRAADYITHCCAERCLSDNDFVDAAKREAEAIAEYMQRCRSAGTSWRDAREAMQSRMSKAAAHIRTKENLLSAIEEAQAQWKAINAEGCKAESPAELAEALRNRQLCYAHLVYLSATLHQLDAGVGSRGSAMVIDPNGQKAHEQLDEQWKFAPEDESFKEKVLETLALGDEIKHEWVTRRPIPESDLWFETAWAKYRNKEIYA